MRLVVATYGAEGDARPFAALCRGLMDAGHEARLLADAATLGGARALAKIANAHAESCLRTIIEAGQGCDAVLVACLPS